MVKVNDVVVIEVPVKVTLRGQEYARFVGIVRRAGNGNVWVDTADGHMWCVAPCHVSEVLAGGR